MAVRWSIVAVATAFLLDAGCAHKPPTPHQPWRFEARPTHGIVRVLPVLIEHDPLSAQREDYLGAGLPWLREWLRSEREAQVAEVPGLLGREIPAAVTAQLGRQWDGVFLNGSFPTGTRSGVRRALQGKVDLDQMLAATTRGTEASALLCWVTGLTGHALTADAFPGEIVTTTAGPVVIDHIEEPFLVEADVGLALVAPDGEVVIRYADRFTTVLSARHGPRRAARDLARDLATEIATVWALDPRLEPGVPSDRVPPPAG